MTVVSWVNQRCLLGRIILLNILTYVHIFLFYSGSKLLTKASWTLPRAVVFFTIWSSVVNLWLASWVMSIGARFSIATDTRGWSVVEPTRTCRHQQRVGRTMTICLLFSVETRSGRKGPRRTQCQLSRRRRCCDTPGTMSACPLPCACMECCSQWRYANVNERT